MATKIPVAGQTYTFGIEVVSQADTDIFKAAPTIAAGDFQRSINGAAFADLDNLPTVTPAGGKRIQIVLSASETTAAGAGGHITVVWSDAAGDEWQDGSAEATVAEADMAVTSTPVTLANGAHGGAAATITLATPVQADLRAILGTLLTETVGGYLAMAFKKLFNVATPALVASDVMRGTDGAYTGTPDSAGTIADAVLDEALAGHTDAGSLGEAITDILADTGTTLPATLAALGPGTGAHSLVYTVTDSGTGLPVADVLVELSTDAAKVNVIRAQRTDSFGVATFYLSAAGTYYVWRSRDGYAFTDPDTEVVA